MSYSIRPFDQPKQQNKPRQEPEGWLGWGARNVAGGIKNAVDAAALSTRAIADPVAYGQNQILSNLGIQQQQYNAPRIPSLEPKDTSEQFLQGLIGSVGLTGAAGGLNAGGEGLLQKGSSVAQSIGKTAANYAASYLGSAAGEGLSDITGASDIPYVGKGIKAAAGIGGAIAGPALGNSVLPSKYKEHFHPIKKELYKKVKGEGRYKIASGEINELAKQFIEDEQRRTGGESPYIRRLNNWINESKGGEIKAEDLHNLKKDLNQYIYREYNSPEYLKALETETHKQITAAGKNGPRTETNLTLPSWTNNLRKADKLNALLTEGRWDNTPAPIKWLFKKFIPGRIVYEGGKRLATPIELFVRMPGEFSKFFAKNAMQALEKYPGSFQSEIKKINHLLNKEEPKKKQSKPTSGFSIRPA